MDKFIAISLVVLGLCFGNTNQENKTKFVGKWGLYITSYDGIAGVLCNACPTVTFTDTLIAEVSLGTQEQWLDWELLGHEVILKSDSASHRFIEDGKYMWSMKKVKGNTELYLKPSKSRNGYLLRKHE